MFCAVYKWKEPCCVDIVDDEIRGTLDNFSDEVESSPRCLIESKALGWVAVRIICLVAPLGLNVGTRTPCQDTSLHNQPPTNKPNHYSQVWSTSWFTQ